MKLLHNAFKDSSGRSVQQEMMDQDAIGPTRDVHVFCLSGCTNT